MSAGRVTPPPPSLAPQRPAQAPGRNDVNQLDYLVEEKLEKTRLHVKIVDLFAALMLMTVALLSIIVGAAMVEAWLFDLGTLGRWLVFATLLGVAGYFIAGRVVPLLVKKIHPAFAARMIEQSQPTLKNSLINFVMFRGDRGGVRREVYDAMRNRAATDLQQVEVEGAVDRSQLVKIGIVLAAIVLVCGVFVAVRPQNALATLQRVAAPWSGAARATRVRIHSVDPGDTERFYRDELQIVAAIEGLREDETAWVVCDPLRVDVADIETRGSERHELIAVDDGYQLAKPISIEQSFHYRIVAGDAVSPDFQVEMSIAPTLLVESIEFEYPAYTGYEKSRSREVDIDDLEGAMVTLQTVANLPIGSAFIELYAPGEGEVAKTIKLTKTDDLHAVGGFTLELNRERSAPRFNRYRVGYYAEGGERTPHEAFHRIAVQADLKPEIELLAPLDDPADLPLNSGIELEFTANDPDFHLQSVKLHAAIDGFEIVPQTLYESDPSSSSRVLRRSFLAARKLKFQKKEGSRRVVRPLAAGDIVEYWLVARDNRLLMPGQLSNVAEASTRRFRLSITEPVTDPARDPEEDKADAKTPDPDSADPESKDPETEEKSDGGEDGGEDGSAGKGDDGEADGESGDPTDGGGGDSESGGEKPTEESEQGDGGSTTAGKEGEGGDGKEGAGDGAQGDSTSKDDQGESGGGETPGPTDGGEKDGGEGETAQEGGSGSGQGNNATESNNPGNQDASDGDAGGAGESQNQQNNGGGDSREGEQGGADGGSDAGKQQQGTPHDGEVIERIMEKMEKSKGEGSGQNQPNQNGNKPPESNGGSDGTKPDENAQAQPTEGGGEKQDRPEVNGEGEAPTDATDGTPEAGEPNKQGEPKAGTENKQGEPKQGEGTDGGQDGGEDSEAKPNGGAEPNDAAESGSESEGEGQQSNAGANAGDEKSKPSDSQGGDNGDRKGGGKQGDGQGAQNEGEGSAGSSTPADEGAGKADQPGKGETGSNPGDGQKAPGATGETSGDLKGDGTDSSTESGGNRPKPGAGEGRSGGAEGNPQDSPFGGSGGYDRNENTKPFSEEISEGDKANLEYSREATDLALEYLKEHKDDPSAAEDLGLTPAEMDAFLKRWQEMKRNAIEGDDEDRKTLDESLRSLGLRPYTDSAGGVGAEDDALRGARDQGSRSKPPAEFIDQFNAYKRGLAR